MAPGNFLGIEGAFDKEAFDFIDKALAKKCSVINVHYWIMAMIRSRSTTVKLKGLSITIKNNEK